MKLQTTDPPRIGSLFSGYGGLDCGVQAVLGGTTAWVSDIDPGACRILAHRYPDVLNLGDITAVDWANVEPVDVLTGGFPCQDVSHAGARAGMGPGTRSGLWSRMADAIDHLRPSLVIAENVRGLLSAEAASDVEPCPWCLGDGAGEPPLRALGAVLADLAELGYDASWYGLRAADVGAPHGRFRVFVLAWPAGSASNAYGAAPARLADASQWEAFGGASAGRGGPGGVVSLAPADAHDAAADGERACPRPGIGSEDTPADADGLRPVRAGGPRRRGARSADSRGHAAADTDGSGSQGAQPAAGRLLPDGCAPADAAGHGRDEGRPEPAGIVGGLDAAVSGTGVAPDADRLGLEGIEWGQGSASLRRRFADEGGAAPADADSDGLGRVAELDGPQVRDGQEGQHRGHTDGLGVEARGVGWGAGSAPADADGVPDERRGAGRAVGRAQGAGEGDRGERERDGGAADDRGATPSPDDRCATCGDLVDYHDEGGFCAGLCGGTCTDPEWGRPGWVDDGEPLPPAFREPEAVADTRGERRDRWSGVERVGREAPERVEAGRHAGVSAVAWGDYEPAIRRWERRLGRPAPAPTEPGSKGQPRLSPRFVEFMMGLPAGWVTDVPGLSRNDQLKALGNGVVPQQAAAAVRFMLARLDEELRWAA